MFVSTHRTFIDPSRFQNSKRQTGAGDETKKIVEECFSGKKYYCTHEVLRFDIITMDLKHFRISNSAMTSCGGGTHFQKAIMKNLEKARLFSVKTESDCLRQNSF